MRYAIGKCKHGAVIRGIPMRGQIEDHAEHAKAMMDFGYTCTAWLDSGLTIEINKLETVTLQTCRKCEQEVQ